MGSNVFHVIPDRASEVEDLLQMDSGENVDQNWDSGSVYVAGVRGAGG